MAIKRSITYALVIFAISSTAWAGHYGHYRYNAGYGHGYHHSGDTGLALLTGLLFGGLVGYAISEDRHRYRDYQHVYYPRYKYNPLPPHRERYPTTLREFEVNCLMTREYITTINIDGVLRKAYGTRCLMADGSWLLGDPRLEPEFNQAE